MSSVASGMFVRSDFAAMICPAHMGNDEQVLAAEFEAQLGIRPQVTIRTPSRRVLLAHTDGTQLIKDSSGDFTILLHGELYGDHPLSTQEAEELVLTAYAEHGPSFFSGLDGSCAFLIVDTRRDLVTVVTDRVNSRRVFHTQRDGCHWIATDLPWIPATECDPVALIPYLISGFICLGRTPLLGVRQLESASIHRFVEGSVLSEPYWKYRFNHEYTDRDPADLRTELASLLRKAAVRRVSPDEQVILSLSGGYDSRAVLGLLREIVPAEKIYCFSYGPETADDVTVPKMIASRFGLQHGVFNFHGDLVEGLRANARLGHGLVDFMPSADVLNELASRFSVPHTVMFSGDECFGWDESPPLPTEQLVLANIVGVRNPLLWPTWIFSDAVDANAIISDVEADWAQIRGLGQNFASLQEFKDFLYVDQRLSNLQLPWREYYFGRRLPIRNLLLDRDILEFIKRLPDSARYSRQLYCDCVREMFPDLFSLPMADFNGNPLDHHKLVTSQAKALETLLENTSALDTIIPVDSIRKLIDDIVKQSAPVKRPPAVSWGRAKQFIKSLAKRVPFASSLYNTISGAPIQAPMKLGARHLERILLMRHVLRKHD
ncbi:hypothetical protein SCT_0259 [Sulfuricella sp. T08]|uniref:asparagine synthase-related protein n=1 Tax=Sulfuricella sp. T08 TaxID=1632857 RepID=UPI0006179AED|nr:asparagine synthase-related protein [Sulfuricella sp. T08]GAO34879.1 hypothetical protein SCT_0259 [Sulfuricella sp. T08]